jgi:hypothetical protein
LTAEDTHFSPDANLFDMLVSRMPSPVSEMDVSVAGFDFASNIDDMFLNDMEMTDGMPPLLDNFSDAEDEDSAP